MARLELLSDQRRDEVLKKIGTAKQEDGFISAIMFTQLSDKATILRKEELVSGSGKQLKRDFNEIRDLRDHLAHANYYAETPEAARQVCQVVRKIRRIQADLLTGIEDHSSPQGEPPWRPHRREEVDEGPNLL